MSSRTTFPRPQDVANAQHDGLPSHGGRLMDLPQGWCAESAHNAGYASPVQAFPTLVDLLHARSAAAPQKTLFEFVAGDGQTVESLTYDQLDRQARSVAARLQRAFSGGSRVLLLFSPGLNFVSAFFGCLYAGMVPVPAALPTRRSRAETLAGLVNDCQPSVVVTGPRDADRLQRLAAGVASLAAVPVWIQGDNDEDLAGDWQRPSIDGSTTALLQYTSGSTSTPRGVVVSQRNLMANSALIHAAFGTTRNSVGVCWLPHYHDMGLIGGILQTIYAGGSSALLAPASFLQRPALWLELISRRRAAIGGGPNFAFEHCLRRTTPAERADLDLSCWEVAFTGAEPIRADTLEAFAAAFEACGFRREAFLPCYGLAESTLMVTAAPRGRAPRTLLVEAAGLEHHRAVRLAEAAQPHASSGKSPAECCGTKEGHSANPPHVHEAHGGTNGGTNVGSNGGSNGGAHGAAKGHNGGTNGHAAHRAAGVRKLVSCGDWKPGQSVVIVDPDERRLCDEGRVGEIWVAGTSVATGYFRQDEATRETFGATLAEGSSERYLRTGDLGFVHRGELYVTGRLKDLIIIRGRNFYPQDIERTVERAHASFRPGHCAAICVGENENELVVLQELEPRWRELDSEAVMQSVCRAVARDHEIEVYGVALLPAGRLPRTSSGKIRRRACASMWQADGLQSLEPLALWTAVRTNETTDDESAAVTAVVKPRSAQEIQAWLLTHLAARLKMPIGNIDVQTPFVDLAMSSLDAVELAAELERWLGRQLSPTAIYNHPSIAALAQWLARPESGNLPSASPSDEPAAADTEAMLEELRGLSDAELEALIQAEMTKQRD